MSESWNALSFRAEPVSSKFANAIHDVAIGDIPAIIVRGAYTDDNCRTLLQSLFDRKLFLGLKTMDEEIIANRR